MSTVTDHDREKRLTKARILMLLDQPFFGTLSTRLPNEFTQDDSNPTACTNGMGIWWDREFFDSLTDAELRGVVAHEVMHVAQGHCWRRGGRDAQVWNIATDKTINEHLKEAGFSLPDGGCYPTPAETGKSAEAIYQGLPKPPPGSGGGGTTGQGAGKVGQGGKPGLDPGKCGAVKDAPAAQQKQAEAEWRVAVAQAAEVAKSQGKLPAGLARLADAVVNPKVPWFVLLRDFVERSARNDYNWTRPNRRYISQGIILPTLISEELPAVVIAIDTSGSIGKRELDQFAAEASAVLGAYETTIHVVYCDSKVAGDETFTRADLPLNLKAKGGGGTAFQPVFNWVEKQGIEPACLIYLTDLCGPMAKEPAYPVMWVCTTESKAPWGQTIPLN